MRTHSNDLSGFSTQGRFFLVLVLATLTSIGLGACQQKSVAANAMDKTNLTHGQVQLTLKKGVTTQLEVLEAFGAPNITTINESGHEVWSYQRHASVTEESSSSAGATILLFGAERSSSELATSSRSILLVIEFDESKLVRSFRSRNTSF